MNAQPLPPSPGKAAEPRQSRRYLALIVSSASAMFAGIALGYALGTVHAHERQLSRGDHHGV